MLKGIEEQIGFEDFGGGKRLVKYGVDILDLCTCENACLAFAYLLSGRKDEADSLLKGIEEYIRPTEKELQSLKKQLQTHKQNLDLYKERVARYGADVPVSLNNAICEEEEHIKSRAKEIAIIERLLSKR